MKIGRNAPCPCGSGKKYKKCCIFKNVIMPEELDYKRWREVHDRLIHKLLEHAKIVFGEEGVLAALHEYWLWPEQGEDEKVDEESLERQMPLFWPWFIFNWEYDSLDPDFELDAPSQRTVAELYTQNRGPQLDHYERRFIEAVNRKPYSFHEVIEVKPGKWILLQDVLSGSRITVQEHTGSQHLQPADIVFGRALMAGDVGMIVGLAPYAIPPVYKPLIIELRGRIKAGAPTVTEEVLAEWDTEIRELYLELDRRLFTRPQLTNTEGDALEFHKVVYDIDSAETAFEKLASLCATQKVKQLRETAERDADGRILRAEIVWSRKGHKASPGLSSTMLGRIIIDGNRLTAEVNSARRAKTIRRKIEAKLGTGARFRAEEIRSLSGMLDDEELQEGAIQRSAEHDALMEDPEVRRQMADIIIKHWQSWVDMEVPALGGKTPREAVQSSDGREAVEALLADAERIGEHDSHMGEFNREGTRWVREVLGLPKPSR